MDDLELVALLASLDDEKPTPIESRRRIWNAVAAGADTASAVASDSADSGAVLRFEDLQSRVDSAPSLPVRWRILGAAAIVMLIALAANSVRQGNNAVEIAEPPELGEQTVEATPTELEKWQGQSLGVGEFTAQPAGRQISFTVDASTEDLVFVDRAYVDGTVLLAPGSTFSPDDPALNGITFTRLVGFMRPENANVPPLPTLPNVDELIAPTADVTAHLETLPGVELRDSGQLVIGGQPAHWWEIGPSTPTIPETASFECDGVVWGPSGERCIKVLAHDLPHRGESIFPGAAFRIYVLDNSDFAIILTGTSGPDQGDKVLPLEEWIDKIQPLLDNITIN
jgi:hypothetical protein